MTDLSPEQEQLMRNFINARHEREWAFALLLGSHISYKTGVARCLQAQDSCNRAYETCRAAKFDPYNYPESLTPESPTP